jgi:ADP-heptose:LPS heptosyltransferase
MEPADGSAVTSGGFLWTRAVRGKCGQPACGMNRAPAERRRPPNRMEQSAPHQRLFRATSALTDRFPRTGALLLDAVVGASVGNPMLLSALLARARRQIARCGRLQRVLVVGDMNIGDAVILQAAVAGLRDYLPDADVDYVIARIAQPLVDGNPEISGILPIYTRPHPVPGDRSALEDIIRHGAYDLVLSFCPFFHDDTFSTGGVPLVDFGALASWLIHRERRGRRCHVVFGTYRFIHALLGPTTAPPRDLPFQGVTVTLADEAVEAARAILPDEAMDDARGVVFCNPDASSIYTRIPFAVQLAMLRRLTRIPVDVLLGAGHSAPGIERRLMGELTAEEQMRVRIVPATLPLDGYAALVDRADVFISADTGPLHIAAARKVSRSGRHEFRNRTVVLSLFGATPARVYGYDSTRPDFFPANQDAPSFSYVAVSPCRNLTCLNKAAKACRRVRCFEEFDAEVALRDALAWLRSRRESWV